MAIRLFTQNEHDSVIQAAYNNLDKVNHRVYINPNQQKNTSINGFYPDIIITPASDNTVKFVIEVETSESVNNIEAQQWRTYADLGGTFYLLVPFASKTLAELICRQNGIKARFGTYRFQNGRYIISYE
ncbi:MAG: hypothetical protein K9J06_08435 [Flavobacteriales bacterium]|nr:hypothetical protein [Flavobacteriales bacterium]